MNIITMAMHQSTSTYDLVSAFEKDLSNGILHNYTEKKFGRCSEFSKWLTEDMLPLLSVEQSLDLYKSSGGRKTPQFKENSIEDIRDAIDFLLYDTIKLEGRFDECVSDIGAYKLLGASKEFVSYLLNLRDPSLFGIWNQSSERALKLLGWYTTNLRKGPWGIRYIDMLDLLHRVQSRFQLPNLSAVDQFNYWLTRFSPMATDVKSNTTKTSA